MARKKRYVVIVEDAYAWFERPDVQVQLQEALDKANTLLLKLRAARQVNWRTLHEPMTRFENGRPCGR